jgi:hypothetical protein
VSLSQILDAADEHIRDYEARHDHADKRSRALESLVKMSPMSAVGLAGWLKTLGVWCVDFKRNARKLTLPPMLGRSNGNRPSGEASRCEGAIAYCRDELAALKARAAQDGGNVLAPPAAVITVERG